ncbi:MAG: hypothetical protein QM768_21630 [Agriterribacter sp.]
MRLTFFELFQLAKHASISNGHAVVAKIGRKIDIYTDDTLPMDFEPANVIYEFHDGVLYDPFPLSRNELKMLRREAKEFQKSLQ